MRLPGPYNPEDDELLYSFVQRIAESNFVSVQDFVLSYLKKTETAQILGPSNLVTSIEKNICVSKLAEICGVDPLELYLKISLYAGVAPLISTWKQSRIINEVFRNDADKSPILIGHSYPYPKELMGCPICYEEDMNTYKYSWVRRAHQIPGVNVCWKHGMRLVKLYFNNRSYPRGMIFPQVLPDKGIRRLQPLLE